MSKINATANSGLARRYSMLGSGRGGSGMGATIEPEWLCAANLHVDAAYGEDLHLEWLEHQYNDFAAVQDLDTWSPDQGQDRTGEVGRIELKTMSTDAGEPKAHFYAIGDEIGPNDQLVTLAYSWQQMPTDPRRRTLTITNGISVNARKLAHLRNALHQIRGGTFIKQGQCPDCTTADCKHVGEPLNAAGTRERSTGPESLRTRSVSYADNFGGMTRMFKTTGSYAMRHLARLMLADTEHGGRYVWFCHQALPKTEVDQWTTSLWRKTAATHDMNEDAADQLTKHEIAAWLRDRQAATCDGRPWPYQQTLVRLADELDN